MTVRKKSKAIDMQKVREGDELLRRAREINPDVRMPDMDELQEITKKGPGRPKGAEETVTIAIRIPVSLRERLDTGIRMAIVTVSSDPSESLAYPGAYRAFHATIPGYVWQ